jgi:hypothetical protein
MELLQGWMPAVEKTVPAVCGRVLVLSSLQVESWLSVTRRGLTEFFG